MFDCVKCQDLTPLLREDLLQGSNKSFILFWQPYTYPDVSFQSEAFHRSDYDTFPEHAPVCFSCTEGCLDQEKICLGSYIFKAYPI